MELAMSLKHQCRGMTQAEFLRRYPHPWLIRELSQEELSMVAPGRVASSVSISTRGSRPNRFRTAPMTAVATCSRLAGSAIFDARGLTRISGAVGSVDEVGTQPMLAQPSASPDGFSEPG